MARDLQPVKLWGHPFSPNPLKVLIILCALDIPYELTPIVLYEAKEEWYTDMNPNGRLPTLQDPNNDNLLLWESGAIIQYLIDRYDKEGKLSYPGQGNERYKENQWAHFQMSGQGPYFGQLVWFANYHSEQLPSAIDRYRKEQDRVFSVIELHLSRTKTPYLIGEKCSYADLMFVPWQRSIKTMPTAAFVDDVLPEKYPLAHSWRMRLFEHEGVKEALRVSNETKIPEKIS